MAAAEGVANLVRNCAEVQRGEKVLIINEQGAMDPAVADLMAEAVRAAGARAEVMWHDAPEGSGPGRGGQLPEELLRAIISADKVIANYPLRDRAIEPHVGPDSRVLIVHSIFRTEEHFA